MAELKPCPFCGGEASTEFEYYGETVRIKCENCGVRTPSYPSTKRLGELTGYQWACNMWNNRKGDTNAVD